MRLCEQVDEWYVLRTTQSGEMCLFVSGPEADAC